MRVFELRNEVWLPRPVEEVFPFFSDAYNLERLTPSFLKFEFLTPGPIDVKIGTLVDYRISLHGVPVKWQTGFTAWEPPYRFVDEQRKGPYRMWIHEHTFESRDGGTVARDYVRYSMFGGIIAQKLIVERDLKQVFDYRNQRLLEIFAGEQMGIKSL
jgi:hypothetical protein